MSGTIKSMTGFGRAEFKTSQGFIRIEIKTINHKYLEISSRLPGHVSEFEDSIRKVISQEIRRGKVSLYISSPDPSVYSNRLVLNEALAKEVYSKILKLKSILKIENKESKSNLGQAMMLREVLHYPDVLSKDTAPNERSLIFSDIEKVLLLTLKK